MMPQPDAAVAIVRVRMAAESVLLIRRSERDDDPWSGHWALPGGRCDPEDQDPLQTALRELEEECGIRLSREQMEASLPHLWARRKAPPYLLVAPFLFAVGRELPTVLDAREAAGSLWVPLRDLRDPARHALRPVPGRPRHILYPAIELDGAPLWGFTYRLIGDWLGLLTPAMPDSGFHEAVLALEFLLSRGLRLRQDWSVGSDRSGGVAVVDGPIPVAETLAHFSQSTGQIPSASSMDVSPGSLCVMGQAFEEYTIRSAS
jgi:8-oxo-dGTP pyrophosphatase MutT (NUDIX family)